MTNLLARIRAKVVLPTPEPPTSITACGVLAFLIQPDITLTASGCPITSLKFFGRYFLYSSVKFTLIDIPQIMTNA